VLELADVPDDPNIPFEIATNLPEDPAAALRDLAMVDGRFEPQVIEASVRRIHEARDRRSRVDGVRVRRVRALRTPPEVELELRIRVPVRWGAARHRPAWWRLAATNSRSEPWRLVDPDVDPGYG
jgi:hypothetical protein